MQQHLSDGITIEVRRAGKLIYDGMYQTRDHLDRRDAFHALMKCVGHLTGWGLPGPIGAARQVTDSRRAGLKLIEGGKTDDADA